MIVADSVYQFLAQMDEIRKRRGSAQHKKGGGSCLPGSPTR